MEDYRIITLHDNKLKVYRDGRVEREKTKLKYQTDKGGYYVLGLYSKESKKFRMIKIHRIMGYTFLGLDIDNPFQHIDHIDNNRKNNNVVNLRIVTNHQNTFNRKNTKGYTKKGNYFESQIQYNNKKIYLGRYKTEAAARYAYLVAKNHYHQF